MADDETVEDLRAALVAHEANGERARDMLARIYGIVHRTAPAARDVDLSGLPERIEHLIRGFHREQYEVDQILGKALEFPAYGPEMFPDGKPDGSVCTGEHTPVTLAMEAAYTIRLLLKERDRRGEHIDSLMTEVDRLREEAEQHAADALRINADLQEAHAQIARQREQLNKRPRIATTLAWQGFRMAVRALKRRREEVHTLRGLLAERTRERDTWIEQFDAASKAIAELIEKQDET